MWSLLWLFKVFRLVNRLLQKSQANFRLPSCISLWSWIFIFYASGYPLHILWSWIFIFYTSGYPRTYLVVLNIYMSYFRLPSCISLWSWIFIFYTSGYPRTYLCGPEYSYFILPVTLVHIPVVLNIHILYFRLPSCIFLWSWIFIFYTSGFPRARALPNFHNITTFAQTLQHLHKHCHIFPKITTFAQTLAHLHKNYHICTNIATFLQKIPHLHKHYHICTNITTFEKHCHIWTKYYHICTNITTFSQKIPHLQKHFLIWTNIATFEQKLPHLHKHYLEWSDPIKSFSTLITYIRLLSRGMLKIN